MNFKEKVGPFPVYVWGIILGVLIVGMVWFQKLKGGPVAPAPVEEGSTASLAGWRDSSGLPVSAVTTPVNAGDVSGVEATNTTWLNQAVKWAQQNGFTPLEAEQALRKYLDGGSLTDLDSRVVNGVNTALGLPPQGVSGSSSPETVVEAGQRAAYFARKAGTSAVYAVFPDGSRMWLTRPGWLALGSPAWQDIPASDPLWSGRVIGIDAPASER